jgi:hypothetical protein
MFSGGEQPWQFYKRRNPRGAVFREERRAFRLRETQRAHPRFVVHHQQVINFAQGARCLSLPLGATALGAAHEHTPPTVRSGVADGPKQRLVGCRMKRTGTQLQLAPFCAFSRRWVLPKVWNEPRQ